MNDLQLGKKEADPKETRKDFFYPFKQWVKQRGLRFKLMFFVGLITFLVMVVLSIFLYNLQRQQLVENARTGTTMISSLLKANLQHAMLTNDADMVNDILDKSLENARVKSIEILNGDGVTKYSTSAELIGQQTSIQEAKCQNCHAVNDPSENKTVIMYPEQPDEFPVLLNVNLIHNQPACYECHDSNDKILGLILMEMSLTGVYDQFSSNFWQVALLIFLATLSIILLIMPLLEHRVIQPVRQLGKGIDGISKGNLDYSVMNDHHDEIGSLARSFDKMREQLKNSNFQRDQREHELDILYQVGVSATQLHDIKKIMEFALDTIVNKFGMADSMIFLWNEEEKRYTVQASHGISQEQITEIDRRRAAGFDFIQKVAETGVELFIPNVAMDDRVNLVWEEKDRSYISFPLMTRGRVLGVMESVSRTGHFLNPNEVEFLKAIGRQIGSSIDSAMLIEDSNQSEKDAQSLYALGTSISSSLALREVLDRIAKAALELVDADISLVALVDENQPFVEVRAAAGENAHVFKGKRNSVAKGTLGFQLILGKPIFSQDLHAVDFPEPPKPNQEIPPTKAFLTVPLIKGEHFLGCIELIRFEEHYFSNKDALLIERLANHVVVVIENAILYRQLRYVSALEEQGRLARELHDQLAQSLGYLNIKTSMTDELVLNGNLEEAHRGLMEMKSVTKNIFMDVREGIFNLRTSASPFVGLFPTLRSYLIEYRDRYGLDVRLDADFDNETEFSPEVANQLMRIIQEALTNVRKHSQATLVWVRCRMNKDTINIQIEDNGAGFDLEQKIDGQHYGLQIMKERAESVGGSVRFESRPGTGTCVIIEAPFLPED